MIERIVEYILAGLRSRGEPSQVQFVPEPEIHVS